MGDGLLGQSSPATVLAKMNNIFIALVNTRLQPGGESAQAGEPFQRLASARKTVETVLQRMAGRHRAEARC
jgi:hypothetical protein